jgi:hypothetical protein
VSEMPVLESAVHFWNRVLCSASFVDLPAVSASDPQATFSIVSADGDREVVRVDDHGARSPVVTVTRGYDGTTAWSWPAGVVLEFGSNEPGQDTP